MLYGESVCGNEASKTGRNVKTGVTESTREVLVRVNVAPGHMVLQFSCCTPDPLADNQGSCLSRLGNVGSDLHSDIAPQKEGFVPLFSLDCLANP